MMAAASGGLAPGAIGSMSENWSPAARYSVVIQLVSALINFLLMLLLRLILVRIWKVYDATSVMRTVVYHSIVTLLPWMPRVVGSNFMSAVYTVLDEAFEYNTLSSAQSADLDSVHSNSTRGGL